MALPMNQKEKSETITRYNERLAEYGYDPLALGWTKQKHVLRYHALLSNWKFKGESILDFGCGFGDLYKYIVQNGILLSYEGIDINENLIAVGKEKNPGINLRVGDLELDGREDCYDFIVSSGVHNYKLNDNWAFIQWTFEKFYRMSRRGFAINFLSNRVNITRSDLYYCDPVKVVELAYKYTNNILLKNDYMPFEYTIVVNVKREFDRDCVVYPEYKGYITGNEDVKC